MYIKIFFEDDKLKKIYHLFLFKWCLMLEKNIVRIYNTFSSNAIIRNKRENYIFMKGRKKMIREKNIWILLIFLLSGIVIGGLLANFAANVSWLSWLAYGQEFGTSGPVGIDLSILRFSIELRMKLNVASIVGMIIAAFIYNKF